MNGPDHWTLERRARFSKFRIRGVNGEHWKKIWLAIARVFDSGWRRQYGEMWWINLERLAGRRWWVKRSLQIEMIDLQEEWGKLVNHGVEGGRGFIIAYAEFLLLLFVWPFEHLDMECW